MSVAATGRAVAHVLGGMGLGGNESLCLQLIRHAPADTRHELIVLRSEGREQEAEFRAIAGLTIIDAPVGPDRRLAYLLWAVRELRRRRLDALLVYSFGLPHLLTGLAGRLAGVPRIMAAAGNPPPRDPALRRKWRLALRLSRFLGVPIHTYSETIRRQLAALGAGLPAGSRPLPSGCDVGEVRARAEAARARRAKGRLVIGMVARLDVIKDQATLLRAFAELRTHQPEAELWLIGGGILEAQLKQLAAELQVTDAVVFWGARTDVPELLGQIDIHVFSTTRDEGFGIAITEAMAAGLPVVASDVPACREVLADGAAGLLVAPGDAEAMATVLGHLAAAPEARAIWGAKAYERAAAEYSIEIYARRWYQELLA